MCAAKDLKLSVLSDGRKVPVGYTGQSIPCRNEAFDGTIFFCHKPPKGSSAPWAYRERLEGYGAPDWLWEVQLHGRFLRKPTGQVWLRGELRDSPMQLGLVSRALCRGILKFARMMAQRRGGDIGYDFGEGGKKPMIGLPIMLLDRIFVADQTHALPVGDSEEPKGTWRLIDGKWVPIERSSVTIDTETYITVVLATSYIDWTNWQLCCIPGLGTLSLETFWGEQGAWITLCDGEAAEQYYLEAHLEPVKGSVSPRSSTVYNEDEAERAQEELVPAGDEQREAVGQSSEEEEVVHKRTAYDSSSDIDEEDLSESVPMEREWIRPPEGLNTNGLTSEDSDARVKEIELALDAPDVGPLRHSLSGDMLAYEDEDSQRQPDKLPRRISRRLAMSLKLPWYLRTGGGQLWWCISVEGWPLCWRRDHQISRLCEAVEPGKAHFLRSGTSIQDMETARRRATALLCELEPALLDEFIRIDVGLTKLLPSVDSGWIGVVESEGRIVERKVSLGEARPSNAVLRTGAEVVSKSAVLRSAANAAGRGGYLTDLGSMEDLPLALRWKSDTGSRSWMDRPQAYFSEDFFVELSRAKVSRTTIADAPAVIVQTPQRQFVFLMRSAEEATKWISMLKMQQNPESPAQAMPTPWKDRLHRWPVHRLVCNDFKLLLDDSEQDPLALSAKLLRLAVSLQGCSADDVQSLVSLSCKLKCVDLTPLEPQDLWCFWVNVYHTLLIHACLVCGHPRNVRHLISFYNNCSYLIGGHIFSLAELEHLVLRSQMAKASTRLMNLLVQVWRRDDKEFEERPVFRAPYNPSSNFRCRPDWRLNLVLCAGNVTSSSRIPVFEKMSAAAFDSLMNKAMEHYLGAAGRLDKKPMQLPYVLYRFRQDAPGSPTEGYDRRWATALAPILGDVDRIAFRNSYNWTMRERLDLL